MWFCNLCWRGWFIINSMVQSQSTVHSKDLCRFWRVFNFFKWLILTTTDVSCVLKCNSQWLKELHRYYAEEMNLLHDFWFLWQKRRDKIRLNQDEGQNINFCSKLKKVGTKFEIFIHVGCLIIHSLFCSNYVVFVSLPVASLRSLFLLPKHWQCWWFFICKAKPSLNYNVN